MEEKEKNDDVKKTVDLNYRMLPNTPSVVAQHMFITSAEGETVISFYEVLRPILPEDVEQREKALQKIEETGVTANCVARVTISSHRLPMFADAFNSATEKLIKQMEEIEKEYAEHKRNEEKS